MPPRSGLKRAVPARHSIRWTFTVSMLVLLLGSAGLAFAIVYHETSRQLTSQIDRDLSGDLSQLSQSLRPTQNAGVVSAQANATRYLRAQPFRGSSTLLFVLATGQAPISNYQEVFEPSAADKGETAEQQAHENRLTRGIRAPKLGFRDQRVVDVGEVRTLERTLTLSGRRLVIGAGEPLLTVSRAQRGIVHSFLLASILLLLAVLVAAYLIGSRITAPLRRMADVAAGIDAGDLSSRAPAPPDRHSEIAVLATSFNHMLDRVQRGVAGQREFVADASHELRTPLTVIQGQLEVLTHRTEVDADELHRVARIVGTELARMRRIVDDLLLLAQSERPTFLHPEAISIAPFLQEIWDGATLIADRRLELGSLTEGNVRGDPDRLAQALRNLINNAIDHTRTTDGTIRLDATIDHHSSLHIRISDDGPGIPPEQLGRIFNRFHRIDAYHPAEGIGGSGLGLSIVRAIVEAHRGHVTAANRTDATGAVFEIVLPGAEQTTTPRARGIKHSSASG